MNPSVTMESTDFDYIVVGAGSAGSIVASQLALAGERVLLLEAGEDYLDPAVQDMKCYYQVAFDTQQYGYLKYNYTSVPQTCFGGADDTKRTVSLPRGRGLGGTHGINASAYVPGHKDDCDAFAQLLQDDHWSWNHQRDTYHTVLHAAIPMVTYGKEAGATEHIASMQSIWGMDYNADFQHNGNLNGICPSVWNGIETSKGGKRMTSFDAFVRPLMGRVNVHLTVYIHHRVNHLVWEHPSDVTRVTGVNA
jgi:choline dehydrogenase